MTVVTLIDPTGQRNFENTEQVITDVTWTYANTLSHSREQATVRHTIGEITQGVYETSFVQLAHPGGKVWDSLFVPLTRDGSLGLSISRWGKDHWVKGQSQVKMISEREWSTTVRSKAMSGGYEAYGFIGRHTPLDSKFNFMTDWHDAPTIPTLPQLAFGRAHAQNVAMMLGEQEIGKMLGRACTNVFPIAKFLEHANSQGHSIPAQIMAAATTYGGTGVKDVANIIASVLSNGTTVPFETPPERAPEPVIDREAVYAGTWGGFA